MSGRETACGPKAAEENAPSSPRDPDLVRSSDPGSRNSPWIRPSVISDPNRRWIDFVWLAYSAFFWISPVQRHQLRFWIYFACAYAVFLGLYSLLVLAWNLRTRRAALVGLALLGYAYTPYNGGFIGVYIFIAAFLPFSVEKTWKVVLLLIAICGSMLAQGYFLHVDAWGWGICTFLALATGGTNIIQAQQRRAERALGLAHEEIERLAKLAERERIARDLHDVLGHTLSVIVLKSELAGKVFEQDLRRAKQEIGEVEQIARTALGDVRQAIGGYRSQGLAAEIERARATLAAAGMRLESAPNIPCLNPAEESVLSLLVREGVTNIIRHSSATHCRIEFQQNFEKTTLTIEDDGRGGIRYEGNGLRGMRERVASLLGDFHIDSHRGTRLLIEIPRLDGQRAS